MGNVVQTWSVVVASSLPTVWSQWVLSLFFLCLLTLHLSACVAVGMCVGGPSSQPILLLTTSNNNYGGWLAKEARVTGARSRSDGLSRCPLAGNCSVGGACKMQNSVCGVIRLHLPSSPFLSPPPLSLLPLLGSSAAMIQ